MLPRLAFYFLARPFRSNGDQGSRVGAKAFARAFRDDRSGGVAIMFSMLLVALCLFVGAAVDLGRWAQARHQTIVAMDAAVLAGGRVVQGEGTNEEAKLAAQQFYNENTKNRTEVIDDTVTFEVVDDRSGFVAKGNAYIKTSFLGFANIPKLALLNESKSEYSRAELTGGGGGPGGGGSNSSETVEIALMLDVTGSMAGSKITDLKSAAKDLINIVISDSAYARPTRVSLVPFSEGVRLPSSANSGARGSPAANKTLGSGYYSTTYYRTDCVVERTGGNKYKDTAPGSSNKVMTLYKPNSWGGSACVLGSTEELLPLSSDKTTLKNRIENLTIEGGTAGHVGTAWAWYTLSPNWNSLWATSAHAAAYGPTVNKIAILMTDGEYNLQYSSDGISSNSGANGSSASQAKSLCAGMKTAGITVYTIGFALGGNATAIDTLSNCASDASKNYTVNTGEELKQAFREIALKIAPLYLSH